MTYLAKDQSDKLYLPKVETGMQLGDTPVDIFILARAMSVVCTKKIDQSHWTGRKMSLPLSNKMVFIRKYFF